MIRPENKNVAAMRFNEVVAKFVHKDLVACVYCASRNNVAAAISPTGENVEITSERRGGRGDKNILVPADQPGKGEEEEEFFLLDCTHLIILTRDNVAVIATEHHDFRGLA